jgi:hypothetical protein
VPPRANGKTSPAAYARSQLLSWYVARLSPVTAKYWVHRNNENIEAKCWYGIVSPVPWSLNSNFKFKLEPPRRHTQQHNHPPPPPLPKAWTTDKRGGKKNKYSASKLPAGSRALNITQRQNPASYLSVPRVCFACIIREGFTRLYE